MKQIIGIILISIPLVLFFTYVWYNAIKISIKDGEYIFIIMASSVTFLPLGAYLLAIK